METGTETGTAMGMATTTATTEPSLFEPGLKGSVSMNMFRGHRALFR